MADGATLAIEASQREQSVAVRDRHGVITLEPVRTGDRSVEDLLPAVDRACARAGVAPHELQAVLLNAGPGGFTGLRIAHAAAQAMAVATGVRVVQVGAAACARAASVIAGDLGASEHVWVCLASKGDETWVACAGPDGSSDGRSMAVSAWSPGACRTLVADEHLPEPWKARVAELGLRTLPLRVGAAAVLAAGGPHLAAGARTPPEALVPVYPREAEAVRLWRQRHGAGTAGTG
jgi:tRNA threonylcarbamoyl adenosine modification protein YeaZ